MIQERDTSQGNARTPVWMLIGSYWPAPEGGAERQCRSLTYQLQRLGFDCTVVTSRSSYASRATDTDQGVTIRRLGILTPIAAAARRGLQAARALVLRQFGARAAAAERVGNAVEFWLMAPLVWLSRLEFLVEVALALRPRVSEAAIIHVHESSWLAGLGVWLGRRNRIPVLCKEATFPALGALGFDTPFRKSLDRERRLASFVVTTQASLESARARGIPADRLHLIPNGVTVPPEPPGRSGSASVLYVGNFSQGAHWKAFDVLFDAWALVERAVPGARLTVVGAGERSVWEQRLCHLGAERSVEFAGRVADPARFYREASVFVLPSRVEGMSNALLEAQSWGLPAVVSDIPGNTAVVEDGVNGLVVQAGNAPALADAVVRLLRAPDVRNRMGLAARERMRLHFSSECVAEQIAALYRELSTTPGG